MHLCCKLTSSVLDILKCQGFVASPDMAMLLLLVSSDRCLMALCMCTCHLQVEPGMLWKTVAGLQ